MLLQWPSRYQVTTASDNKSITFTIKFIANFYPQSRTISQSTMRTAIILSAAEGCSSKNNLSSSRKKSCKLSLKNQWF